QVVLNRSRHASRGRVPSGQDPYLSVRKKVWATDNGSGGAVGGLPKKSKQAIAPVDSFLRPFPAPEDGRHSARISSSRIESAKRACTNWSGSKGCRSSTFSPSPTHLMGIP